MSKEKELELVEREMKVIRKELDLYKRDGMLKIQEEFDKARQALVEDWSKIEHEYHSARQEKETEIAKLDALIGAKKDILAQDNNMIHFLEGIITNLSKMHTK